MVINTKSETYLVTFSICNFFNSSFLDVCHMTFNILALQYSLSVLLKVQYNDELLRKIQSCQLCGTPHCTMKLKGLHQIFDTCMMDNLRTWFIFNSSISIEEHFHILCVITATVACLALVYINRNFHDFTLQVCFVHGCR